MWASGNTVSDNGFGLYNNGGLLESAGNNAVRNNTVDKSGTISVVAME
jgi:parallel beta-helix repeat protein